MSKADKHGRHHLHIELTSEQYRLLSAKARQCGLTRRAFLTRLLEGQPVKALPSQEIKALRTEVHKIGVNINQIARSVNARIARAEDARRGLYLLEQVYALMYEVAKSNGHHQDPGPEGPPGCGRPICAQRGQDPGAGPHRPPQLRPRP